MAVDLSEVKAATDEFQSAMDAMQLAYSKLSAETETYNAAKQDFDEKQSDARAKAKKLHELLSKSDPITLAAESTAAPDKKTTTKKKTT